ncbi:MAG: carboxypeptidase regulatory-like domain-containing protein [Acidimicrobiales bacterium]
MPRTRRAWARLFLVIPMVVAAACSGGGSTPPTTVPAPVETTVPVPTTLAPTTVPTTIPGPPRTTMAIPVDISPGSARITGTVVGPAGPVAGAVVRIERLVGAEVATADVSAANGSFSLPSVRGGRYRVRAWKQPDLVQSEPEVFFLAADEAKNVELSVTQVSAVTVQASVDPDPLPPADSFVIGVFVYAGSVSDQGTVQAAPRAGQEVQIVLGAGLIGFPPDRAVTDAGGRANFRARCRTPGPQAAELVVGAANRVPVPLPDCRSG